MKFQYLFKAVAVFLVSGFAINGSDQAAYAQLRAPGTFYCGDVSGVPATRVIHPVRGDVPFIRWVQDFAPGWSPPERCNQVSRKFQDNRPVLNYIVPGTSPAPHKLPVLCASQQQTRKSIDCPDARILMTLRKGDNPNHLIERIEALNLGDSVNPLDHSSSVLIKNGAVVNMNVNRFLYGVGNSSIQRDHGRQTTQVCTKLYGCP